MSRFRPIFPVFPSPLIYLQANLLTGAINLFVQTMYTSDLWAIVVLSGYSGIICAVAVYTWSSAFEKFNACCRESYCSVFIVLFFLLFETEHLKCKLRGQCKAMQLELVRIICGDVHGPWGASFFQTSSTHVTPTRQQHCEHNLRRWLKQMCARPTCQTPGGQVNSTTNSKY